MIYSQFDWISFIEGLDQLSHHYLIVIIAKWIRLNSKQEYFFKKIIVTADRCSENDIKAYFTRKNAFIQKKNIFFLKLILLVE